MDIAQDIAKLYAQTKLDASAPISMKNLDPDTYFLVEFGPCKLRSAGAIQGEFVQKLTAATLDSDDDSEDISDDEHASGDDEDEEAEDLTLEAFTDKGTS